MKNYSRIIIVSSTLLFLFSLPASAYFWNDSVVIYNFRDVSSNTNHSYYSYIIPKSIAVELKKKKNISVETCSSSMNCIDQRNGSGEDKENHLRNLAQKGNEHSADFVVAGTFSVHNRRIHIESQIYDVKTQKIIQVDDSSNDLGALVFLVIDKITGKIESELNRCQIENHAQNITRHLHASIDGVFMAPSGRFADLAGNGFGGMLRFFMRDTLLPALDAGITGGYIYFPGSVDEVSGIYMIPVMGVLSYRFSSGLFTIGPELMGGYSYTVINYQKMADTFQREETKESAFEPVAMAGAELTCRFGSLTLRLGAHYGLLFESTENQSILSVNLGAGVLF